MSKSGSRRTKSRMNQRLEDLVGFLQGPSRGSTFVLLVAELLRAMGFTDVYVRKGTENGRDIDARFGSEIWFFECKFTAHRVDTPAAAYKLLQVDSLSDAVQPDHYVFVTNGTTASILRDIAKMKNADKSVKYNVHFWSNDEQYNFDDILLSYPNTYERLIVEFSLKQFVQVSSIFSDFNERSINHIRVNQKFLTRFRGNAGLNVGSKGSETALMRFALDQTLQISSEITSAIPLCVLVTAIPHSPVASLYNFRDLEILQRFTDTMRRLGAEITKAERDHLIFREDLTTTIITNFGSVIMIDSEISVRGEIHLPEWLPCIRENSLRTRNFVKLGILSAPFHVKAYIIANPSHSGSLNLTGLDGMSRRRNMIPDISKRVDEIFLGFRGGHEKKQSDPFKKSPSVAFESAMVRIDGPPETHTEMARALASSLWAFAGKSPQLTECAEKWLLSLKSKLLRQKSRVASVEIFEYFDSIWWLNHPELLDRDFSIFEKILQEGVQEQADINEWRIRAGDLLRELQGKI